MQEYLNRKKKPSGSGGSLLLSFTTKKLYLSKWNYFEQNKLSNISHYEIIMYQKQNH